MWESPLKTNYEKYAEYISPIGIIYNPEEFFENKDLVKELSPPLNSLVDLKHLNIANAYCRTIEGNLAIFNLKPYPTYNKDSYQGYQHAAWDFGSLPTDFFSSSFSIKNPFKVDAKLTKVVMQESDRNGFSGDYGSYGNYIDLTVNLMDNLDFTIRYAHLKQGSCKLPKGSIVKPGENVASVGCSGYSSLLGIHTHVEVFFSKFKIDPFAFNLIEDQERLVSLFSYLPLKKDAYVAETVFPKYTSSFKSWLSVNNSMYGNFHQIKVKDNKYCIISEKPISDVLMVSNPYGEIKPINFSIPLGRWASYWINKLIGKTGTYLFDVADNIKHYTKELVWYEDKERTISKEETDVFNIKQSKTFYVTEFTVKSISPTNDKAYGLYEYYPVTSDGKLGYKFTLELVK